ncbi:MAG: hypothetical protein CVU45_00535 [Chloroflexi bacterium HGW-Chloroflexi-7]|nr:MAG: hypothetical protein CVU45_00535 [Chloroflexi bacterium HGW-Chloroflexi-7]
MQIIYYGFVHKNKNESSVKNGNFEIKNIRFLCFQFFSKTKTNQGASRVCEHDPHTALSMAS